MEKKGVESPAQCCSALQATNKINMTQGEYRVQGGGPTQRNMEAHDSSSGPRNQRLWSGVMV